MHPFILATLVVYVLGIIGMFCYVVWSMRLGSPGNKSDEHFGMKEFFIALLMAVAWPLTAFLFLD